MSIDGSLLRFEQIIKDSRLDAYEVEEELEFFLARIDLVLKGKKIEVGDDEYQKGMQVELHLLFRSNRKIFSDLIKKIGDGYTYVQALHWENFLNMIDDGSDAILERLEKNPHLDGEFTFSYTMQEGGHWIPAQSVFSSRKELFKTLAAFSDGRYIWNGIRDMSLQVENEFENDAPLVVFTGVGKGLGLYYNGKKVGTLSDNVRSLQVVLNNINSGVLKEHDTIEVLLTIDKKVINIEMIIEGPAKDIITVLLDLVKKYKDNIGSYLRSEFVEYERKFLEHKNTTINDLMAYKSSHLGEVCIFGNSDFQKMMAQQASF